MLQQLEKMFDAVFGPAKPETGTQSQLSQGNLHAHKCPLCGTIWRHDPDTIGERNHKAAHTCPVEGCKGYMTWWHEPGDEGRPASEVPAQFCNNGRRIIAIEGQS